MANFEKKVKEYQVFEVFDENCTNIPTNESNFKVILTMVTSAIFNGR